MKRYKLTKQHKFIKDSSRNPDFTYTIFEIGEEITEKPYNELGYGEKKAIRDEKKRGKHFIWAYDPKNIKILEKKTHPFVRKEMLGFIKKNSSKKNIFLEIPLLVESNLSKHFDKTIFISCPRKTRLKRYLGLGGDRRVFNILDKRQASFKRKKKYCDFHIVNNKSISLLKKKLINIFKNYE